MRVMVAVKASKESEAGALPDPKLLAAMAKYNEEPAKVGIVLAVGDLRLRSKGKRVKFYGDQRVVTRWPTRRNQGTHFRFWIWKANSIDEAAGWLKRAPFDGRVEIEIRQCHGAEDYASVGKETVEQHARLQAGSERLAQSANK
ncbi:MAG: YciI family protein [Candidatus Acidiferrales bacterium]